MDPFITIIVFIYGTLVGSFINVVSLRYNTGLSITRGRSKCMNCDVKLKWYELMPLLSFMFLRGKCRTCKNYISKQYPLVEFITGLVFVLIFWRQVNLWDFYGFFEHGLFYSTVFFLYNSLVFSLLLVIAVYDIRHKVIPDELSYTFIVLSSFKLLSFFYLCSKFGFATASAYDLLTPFILFFVFASLWYFSNGKWMGFGDAKLVFGIGAFLGFTYGISAIILAFWIGAAFGLALIFSRNFSSKSKKINMSSQIPFAPFLILATIVVFFWRIDVLSLNELFGFI